MCLTCSASLYQCPWYSAFFSVVSGWSRWPDSHSPSLHGSLAGETSAKLYSCDLSCYNNLPLCGKLFGVLPRLSPPLPALSAKYWMLSTSVCLVTRFSNSSLFHARFTSRTSPLQFCSLQTLPTSCTVQTWMHNFPIKFTNMSWSFPCVCGVW